MWWQYVPLVVLGGWQIEAPVRWNWMPVTPGGRSWGTGGGGRSGGKHASYNRLSLFFGAIDRHSDSLVHNQGALTLVPFACSVLEHDSPLPIPPARPVITLLPKAVAWARLRSSRRNTINTSSPSVLAAITTMENNNENNTEIVTENTIGTFLTSLLIWSRSFKIRSSLNAGFFDFDVAQGLRHPAHVAYPCVCACHLISICTLATAHLSQVCRGQGPVPCRSTDGVLTLAKPFRT